MATPYLDCSARDALVSAAGAGRRVLASASAGARPLRLRAARAARAVLVVVVVVGMLPRAVLVVLVVVVFVGVGRMLPPSASHRLQQKKILSWSGFPSFQWLFPFRPARRALPAAPYKDFFNFLFPRAPRGGHSVFQKGGSVSRLRSAIAPLPPKAVVGLLPQAVLVVLVVVGVLASLGR